MANQEWELYNPKSGIAPDWAQNWDPWQFQTIVNALGVDKSGIYSFGGVDAREDRMDKYREKFYQALGDKGYSLGHQPNAYQVFDGAGAAVGPEDRFDSGGLAFMALPLLLAAGYGGLQGLGAAGGGAGAGAGAAGATNMALIESALGTAGYGASSAGLGGISAGIGAGLGGVEAALGGGLGEAGAVGNGAFLGEGVASGVGAWDTALANAAAGGGAGLGGADQVIKTMGQGAPSVDVGAISAGSPLQTGLGSQLPGSVEMLGQFGGGLFGATNPALIESAAGTPGYGASSAGLGGGAGTLAGGGLGGLGDLLSGAGSILDSVGGIKNVLPIVGGLLGAGEAGKPNTATSQSKTDPRLDQYLYGSGYGDKSSLLGAAQDLWQQNKSGMNPTMQTGLDMQRSALMDPTYGQGYKDMRSAGSGLLNQGVAGNPFTSGQMRPPTMQAGGPGGLLGGMDFQALMQRGRGLIG